MTNQQPVIELVGYSISSIDYKVYDTVEEYNNIDFEDGSVSVEIGLNPDNTKSELNIKTDILDEENLRSIRIKLSGYFNINIQDEPEKYLAVNGSAILYPYLRSIVSIVTSLDSENQILLPTINTSGFAGELNPKTNEDWYSINNAI